MKSSSSQGQRQVSLEEEVVARCAPDGASSQGRVERRSADHDVQLTWEEKMTRLTDKDELPHSGSAHRFEGYRYGDANASFFLSETSPGSGPELHAHPYAEVFVVQEGELMFTVGDATVEAQGGQIIVAPAGVPHRFVNSGLAPKRHVDIHTSRRMTTRWLESPKAGHGNRGGTS
jgi:quercetin dioxygenase-like cupin family protein